MRIDFNRMSKLAGLSTGTNKKSLFEGAGHYHEAETNDDPTMDEMMSDEEPTEEGMGIHEVDSDSAEEGADPFDEVFEIDEVMLVQELRRAKGIMQENKRRRLSESRNRQIFERQLKQVIDEEVLNVMDEMNLTAGWVYGGNAPRRSRKGYTNQGSMMPGLGFRR